MCSQRDKRQVQQNWLKHAGIPTSQQQLFINRHAFIYRKEGASRDCCVWRFVIFCGAVAEYFSIKWEKSIITFISVSFRIIFGS